MQVLKRHPWSNGFTDAERPEAERFLSLMMRAHHQLHAGKLYVRWTDGDRKGSIARLIPNEQDAHRIPEIGYRQYRSWNKDAKWQFNNDYFYGTAKWEGRRNTAKVQGPKYDCELLVDYDGPTVWEKFDAKAAQKKILEAPGQLDMDGKELNIGDRVLYINARYGSAACLDRGTVKEFKVSVDSKSSTVYTIIQNGDGIESKINNSADMIVKI